MRSLLPFVGAVALVYGVLTAWVFFTQRGQIYFPTPVSEAPGQAEVVVIPGVGHNTLDWAPAYLETVRSFLRSQRVAGLF